MIKKMLILTIAFLTQHIHSSSWIETLLPDGSRLKNEYTKEQQRLRDYKPKRLDEVETKPTVLQCFNQWLGIQYEHREYKDIPLDEIIKVVSLCLPNTRGYLRAKEVGYVEKILRVPQPREPWRPRSIAIKEIDIHLNPHIEGTNVLVSSQGSGLTKSNG